MTDEIWKIHPRDSRYEISNMGNIRRLETGRMRKPSINKNGYCVTVFSKPGGQPEGYYVHRCVMEAFVGKCPSGMEVSHLDGNSLNNRLDNLTYESRKMNMGRKIQHGTENTGVRNGSHKLDDEKVLQIRDMYEKGFKQIEIARHFNASPMTIYRAAKKHLWRHVK